MTKVKMLKTVKGSPDGLNVNLYRKGQEYDVNDILLQCFIDDGVIELTQEEKAIDPIIEDKSIKKAPENKGMKRGRKKNKS